MNDISIDTHLPTTPGQIEMLQAIIAAEASMTMMYRSMAPFANTEDGGNSFSDGDPVVTDLRELIAKFGFPLRR